MLAVLALVLRLGSAAVPIEPVPTAGGDLIALFGEHALCLAAAEGKLPGPAAPAPADAPGHCDGHTCCPSHATAGFALPPVAATVEIARYPATVIAFAPEIGIALRRPRGSVGARAPPGA